MKPSFKEKIKNFINKKKKKNLDQKNNSFIKDKMQSMADSQGVSDYSGSGYNGPGNECRS